MFRVQVQPGPRAARWIGALFLAVGLGLLGVGGFLATRTLEFRAQALVAPGTVVNVVAVTDDEGDVTYRPVIAFTTSKGQRVEFRSNIGYGDPSAYDIDDPVEVLYDPARPSTATLKTVLSVWFPTIILGTLGVCFAGMGTLILVVKSERSYRPLKRWSFYRSWRIR